MQQDILGQVRERALDLFKISDQEFNAILNDPINNRALGCFFGASIGDALGSYCEFEKEQSEEKMEKVMTMPGGGTFQTQPGQVTDDTEMALHLLKGLKHYDASKNLDEQVFGILYGIGFQYIKWMHSHPFDIGITTKSAINLLEQYIGHDHKITIQEKHTHLDSAFKSIKAVNKNSLSNGYLMRNSPLGVMLALIKKNRHEDIGAMTQLIKGEINMTHGNELCFDSGLEWIQLLSDMIIRSHPIEDMKEIYEKSIKFEDKVWEWKQEGISKPLMDATHQSGFAKIAYSYGYNQLKFIVENCKEEADLNADLYKRVMRLVIQKGGDTDTNAAIVGGLIGSIVGFKNLPKEYVEKQLRLKFAEKLTYYNRPHFYEPVEGFLNLFRLFLKFK